MYEYILNAFFRSQKRFISFSLFFVETVTYFSLSESIFVVPFWLNKLRIPTREKSAPQHRETEIEICEEYTQTKIDE